LKSVGEFEVIGGDENGALSRCRLADDISSAIETLLHRRCIGFSISGDAQGASDFAVAIRPGSSPALFYGSFLRDREWKVEWEIWSDKQEFTCRSVERVIQGTGTLTRAYFQQAFKSH